MTSARSRTRLASAATAAAVGLAVAGCSGASQAEEGSATGEEPAHVEEIAGSDVSRITLSDMAAERLGIATAPVKRADGFAAKATLTVPYSALMYDVEGGTWVYTVTEPLSFERAPVKVVTIDGDEVLLSKGPNIGTEVVTVGAAELFGEELDVGH